MNEKIEGFKMFENYIKKRNEDSIPEDFISKNLLNHVISKEEAEEWRVRKY